MNLGLLDRFVQRTLDNEEALQRREPERLQRLQRWTIGSLAVVFVCLVLSGAFDDSVPPPSPGVFWARLGPGGDLAEPRGQGLRRGWLNRRIALMQSMAEAQRRGLTVTEWLDAEAERDDMPINRLPVEPDGD